MAATRQKRSTRSDGRATRQRIVRAARAMFAASGYEATSLRQVASAAEVDLATLKYHFGDKAGLFGEVYHEGHDAFIETIAPFLATAAQAASPEDVRAALAKLASGAVRFVREHEWFVRTFLYRLLEDASDISGLEEELQGVAVGLIDEAFASLIARGLMRPVDVPAVIVLLVTSWPIWVVAARNKPAWLGAPSPFEPDGEARQVALLRDLLERLLVP